MKNILLIATGGTIASKDNGNGLTPSIDVSPPYSAVWYPVTILLS